MTTPLALTWLNALQNSAVVSDLESIYTDTAREIERRGPACWASGRCCNFERTGHLLYVTGLEAAYTVSRVGGAGFQPAPGGSLPVLRTTASRSADAGTCPFLASNLCGVHTIKPLGCRVYFCDRSARQWQQDLSERMLARLRAIHDDHSVEYRYGEWRAMLALFAEGE